MEINSFRKIVHNTLVAAGFKKQGTEYYRSNPDIICIIYLQRSEYSDLYYLNIGYVIKKLNPSLDNPRHVDGDIQTRFGFNVGGKMVDSFNPKIFAEKDGAVLTGYLEQNIKELIEPVSSLNGLKTLIEKYPDLLYLTSLPAKELLGF